jgi:pilus assembly protein CpaE
MALKQAKVITVTSTKGGTGKTTLALSLAGLISQDKKRVLILDADLYGCAIGLSTLSDPDKTIFTLVDDLKNNRYIDQADYVSKYNEYLYILPAPKDPRQANKIGSKYLSIILSKVKPKYDYIIMDTNHTLTDFNLVALDESDEILYVITNDPVDLKNMRTITSIFTDIEKTNYKIILNDALSSSKGYLTKYDIKHMIKDNIDYIIPSSFVIKNIDSYVLDGKIITLDKKIKTHYKKGMDALNKIKTAITKEEE